MMYNIIYICICVYICVCMYVYYNICTCVYVLCMDVYYIRARMHIWGYLDVHVTYIQQVSGSSFFFVAS